MRICFVLEYYYPHVGGAEVLFQHLAEGLVNAGHSCHVVTSRLPGTAAQEELNGVQIHRVRVPRWGDRYWFTVLSLAACWKYSRDADIMHTMVYNGAFPARLIALVRRKPVVIHVFEVIGEKWYQTEIHPLLATLYDVLERVVLSIPFDAYSCISLSTLKALAGRGIPEHKLFLAYPGIDYTLFDPRRATVSRSSLRERLGIPNDCFLYLYYGRPGFVKGVQYLVNAVPRVARDIPNSVLLLILSRKPESGRARVSSRIRELGLSLGKMVIIIDPVDRAELPSYIAASDCVVVPSLGEGFGFTCAEACAMERPVVATTAGSLPEVVSGDHILVAPGNGEALADGIVRIRRKEFTRSDKKHFRWEDTVKNHEKAYGGLLADPTKQ